MPQPGQIVRYNLGGAGSPTILYGAAGEQLLTETGTSAVRIGAASGKVGFFGTAPVVLPTVPLTTPDAQDIIDALLLLGLVAQSD